MIPYRLTRYSLLALSAFLLILAAKTPAAEKAIGLRAGAYAQDVTPTKFPISVNGNMADIMAKGAHDRLHARCLVLDDGKKQLALVVVDSCMIPREILDDAKEQAASKTDIPTSHMLISATHTHTAPTLGGVFQSDPDADYQKYIAAKIAEGIKKAQERLRPAEAGWAVAKEPNQVFNRRWRMKPENMQADPFGGLTDRVRMNPGYQAAGLIEPAGPVDPEVSILSVRTREGRPLALLANYSLHYVGGVPALSADYFGMFAERIGQLVEGDKDFVGILSNGTSGDVNNVNFAGPSPGPRKSGERARYVADQVAKVALDAYRTIQHKSDWTLAAAEKELELDVRKPSADDLARARAILDKAAEMKKKVLTTMPEIYARETVLMDKYPDMVKLKVQGMRIGNLGIAAIPCEVFTEIGLEIKKKSPLKPTFTIELANGYNGYLPTPEQHKLGGYETWRARSSYLEKEASPKIVANVIDLLSRTSGH